MDDLKRFQDVVEKYAKAYADFESIQKAGKDRISFFFPKKEKRKQFRLKQFQNFLKIRLFRIYYQALRFYI